MTSKFAILLLCLSFHFSYAQEFTVTGNVSDDKGEPLPFANVVVSLDTALIAGALTDETGQFELALNPGSYDLTVSYIGYESHKQPLEVSNDMSLSKIQLILNSAELDEVLITEFRNEMKAGYDKKVVPITDELKKYNTNLSELLEMVPIVSMDIDGNPTIPGKSNVIVLVDGREPRIRANDLATVLRMIPTDQILRIEIMTNPPAKYTKSNAAVINVVTNRKPQKGAIFNGWSRADLLGAVGAGGNFTMKQGKFSLSSWAGRWGWRSNADVYFERNNFDNVDLNRIEMKSDNIYRGYGVFGGISPEYQFDDKNILSFYVGGNTWNNDHDLNRSVELFDGGGNLTSEYKRIENRINNGGSTFVGLEYFKLFEEEERELNIEIGADVPLRDVMNSSEIVGEEPFYQSIEEYEIGWNLEFEAEYFDPIDSSSSINFDFEIRKELPFDVEVDYVSGVNENETIRDEGLSYLNTMEQLEQEFSFTYSKRFSALGINLDLGQEYLQYDYLFDQVDHVKRDYFFIVPKVGLNYSFDKKGELGLIYKYGARAPDRYELNPNVQVDSDGLSESFGNPDLDPERSHEVEMNYGFYIGKFNLGATGFWRFSENAVSNFIRVNNEGVQQSTFANNGKFSRLGGEFSLSGSIKKLMKVNFNASLFDSRIHFEDDRTMNTLSYEVGANVNVYLPKDFIVSLSGDYNGPQLQIQGERTGFYQVRGSLRKSFLDGKINASVNFNDLFRSLEQTNRINGESFNALERIIRQPAYIGFGLNVRFGELKDRPKSSRARQGSQG